MHLEQVALIVDDYDSAIAFYVDVLGFELVEDSPSLTNDGRPKRWVVVRPPGATTALLLAQADGERQRAAVGDQFAGRVGLFLRVDDVAATYERMRAAGVEFVGEPRDEPYGQVVVFVDVAGNRWDLLGPRPVSLISAASAEFERVLRDLPPDCWDRPTPSDMCVRELVQHVVVGNLLTAQLLEGVDRDDARVTVAGDQLGHDPLAAVMTSARRQAHAFATTPLDRLVAGPRGDVPVATYLRFRLVDMAVHAWDLLRAADLDETLDPRVVDDVLAAVEPYLDELLAYGVYGEGPSETLPPDALPQIRLLDMVGRRP